MSNATMANPRESIRDLAQEVRRQHAMTQDTAYRLSMMSIRQWEKALTGIVALPTAAALSAAAAVLYTTSMVERGFELFEGSLSEVGRMLSSGMEEARGHNGSAE